MKNAFLLNTNLIIIMEYVSGGELKDYVVRKGRLEEAEALEIFIQLLNAVQHCHTLGVVHRDLKLENILFTNSSRKDIKVVDFGIAGLMRNNMGDRSRAGSLKYMAPEVLTEESTEARASLDVWSMGCILFAVLCGDLPFTGKTPQDVAAKVKACSFAFPSDAKLSRYSKDLIQKMLNPDYTKRITIREMWEHPWIEGRTFDESPQKNPSPERPMAGLTKQWLVVQRARNNQLRPFKVRSSIGARNNNRSSFLGLPSIGKYREYKNSRVVLAKLNVRNGSEITPECKSRKKCFSMLQSKPQEKAEKIQAKLCVLRDYENIPSFMQPIHRSKQEKQIINSFVKDCNEARRTSVSRTRMSRQFKSRCNIFKKDAVGITTTNK
eukprot:TRINITY_DN14116_c0_g3_i1.p1 TRINITY_DN14116_c0_g3~~TRINITY_DN14116_c0_g3_i1.p1  ORF type:complete len:380 (+),score=120.43 TRINITY_DN14116_c0_g3_i1:649-1788(+)